MTIPINTTTSPKTMFTTTPAVFEEISIGVPSDEAERCILGWNLKWYVVSETVLFLRRPFSDDSCWFYTTSWLAMESEAKLD